MAWTSPSAQQPPSGPPVSYHRPLNGHATVQGPGQADCVRGKGTRASGPGQPSSPHTTRSAASALLGGRPPGGSHRYTPGQGLISAAPAATQSGRKISGTEVYFHGDLTVGPHPHSPPCTHPQGLTRGKKWQLVSLTPLLCSFYLKKKINKSLRGRNY